MQGGVDDLLAAAEGIANELVAACVQMKDKVTELLNERDQCWADWSGSYEIDKLLFRAGHRPCIAGLAQGDRVDYYAIWSSNGARIEPSRKWFKGYVVVHPLSPYAPGCAVIQREKGDAAAFNVPLTDIRKAVDNA